MYEAAAMIDDQEVLSKVVKNDPKEIVRWTAVENIQDQELLSQIVLNDEADVAKKAL